MSRRCVLTCVIREVCSLISHTAGRIQSWPRSASTVSSIACHVFLTNSAIVSYERESSYFRGSSVPDGKRTDDGRPATARRTTNDGRRMTEDGRQLFVRRRSSVVGRLCSVTGRAHSSCLPNTFRG